MLGFIKRRAKEFDDPYVTKFIFCSLVRSTLEYCHIVWAPLFQCDIDRLESIQKQFLLFALRHLHFRDNFHLPPYVNRLKLLNLSTISQRRELAEALFVFDLLTANINCPNLVQSLTLNPFPRTLRHPRLLLSFSYKSRYTQNEPINRCIATFNKFSSLYDPDITRDSFKTKIINYISRL